MFFSFSFHRINRLSFLSNPTKKIDWSSSHSNIFRLFFANIFFQKIFNPPLVISKPVHPILLHSFRYSIFLFLFCSFQKNIHSVSNISRVNPHSYRRTSLIQISQTSPRGFILSQLLFHHSTITINNISFRYFTLNSHWTINIFIFSLNVISFFDLKIDHLSNSFSISSHQHQTSICHSNDLLQNII